MSDHPLQRLNDYISNNALLGTWNIYTTILLGLLTLLFLYTLLTLRDPDTHPVLLARQSAPAPIRQKGESAVYRALDVPHSYPLRSGLDVKDPAAPRWQPGKDGDLRDVWRRAREGVSLSVKERSELAVQDDGKAKKARVAQVIGKEEVIVYDFEMLSGEIAAIGKELGKGPKGKRVAIALGNSVEWLVAFFACAFYGYTPILVPQQQPLPELASILKDAKADILIVAAGAVPLVELTKLYGQLQKVVWVVSRSSRHMDWHEVPEGEGGKLSVAVWHEVIDEADSSEKAELPTELPKRVELPHVVVVAQSMKGRQLVEYTQANIIAAVAAQLAVLPRSYQSTHQHHLTGLDNVLSLCPLTDIYPLTIILTALYSNSSIVLVSVTGPKANYATAFQGALPTVIIADPDTLARLWAENNTRTSSSIIASFLHRQGLRSLEAGKMPHSSSNTRLIYTYDTAHGANTQLSTSQLADLRLYTGARIIYAHTVPGVAGAACQTNMLDYTARGRKPDAHSHLGPPLSCVEVKLLALAGQDDINDQRPAGHLEVKGPAVVGGEVRVEEVLVVGEANTLAYLE